MLAALVRLLGFGKKAPATAPAAFTPEMAEAEYLQQPGVRDQVAASPVPTDVAPPGAEEERLRDIAEHERRRKLFYDHKLAEALTKTGAISDAGVSSLVEAAHGLNACAASDTDLERMLAEVQAQPADGGLLKAKVLHVRHAEVGADGKVTAKSSPDSPGMKSLPCLVSDDGTAIHWPVGDIAFPGLVSPVVMKVNGMGDRGPNRKARRAAAR